MNKPYIAHLQKVVTTLRNATEPQIRGEYSREVNIDGKLVWGYCAMGLLRNRGLDYQLDGDMFASIMDLNDDYRMSFNEIADWIQEKIDYPED